LKHGKLSAKENARCAFVEAIRRETKRLARNLRISLSAFNLVVLRAAEIFFVYGNVH